MKIILITLIALCWACNSGNPQKDQKEVLSDETTSKKALPDTIKTLCGFRIGMTEKEIRNYVKNHSDKFFIDNKNPEKVLLTKIDNLKYQIHISLNRGKLTDIIYFSDMVWNKIDDVEFKEHYKNIYNQLKGLNNYASIDDVYFNQTQIEWPVTYDGRTIGMAEFHLDEKVFYNLFIININRDEETNKYYLTTYYSGEGRADSDPAKSKRLYFDKI